MTIAATALDEKVHRLEKDVRDLEDRVEDARQKAEDANRAVAAARQSQEQIAAELKKTTRKAEDVDAKLKARMQEDALNARQQSGVWMGISIVAAAVLFTWSLLTGKFVATMEYLRQFASGRSQ
jgi:predicted  nucleic acid-binding Zn-ribbon protein